MATQNILAYFLDSVKKEGNDVKILQLKPEDGKVLPFKAGHFINLHVKDEKGDYGLFRPYSLASSPLSSHLELCIKILSGGRLTSILDSLKPRDKVGISGPFGFFTYEADNSAQNKCVFVAGGTGIAPIMSMLRTIKEKRTNGEFILFYSSRTEQAILYREELKALPSNIKVIHTLTDKYENHWEGERGFITKQILSKYVTEASSYLWHICGPLGFVQTVKAAALEMGASNKDIKIEGWG